MEAIMSESRKTKRRETERRLSERRIILFEFGSDEWCRIIQREYLLWPKKDRRDEDRRSSPRRQSLRRDKNSAWLSRRKEVNQKLVDLLTQEEKDMINDLIRSD